MVFGRTSILRFALLATAACSVSQYGTPSQLEYQKRGNRYEGIKPKPVAGYDIELLSARCDYSEDTPQTPVRLRIKFYLEAPSPIYLTVRELDYKYYYWLDKVEPSSPWSKGFSNEFEWSTADVIGRLGHLAAYDLGVVARQDRPEPSKVERIVPVIFYHSSTPSNVTGYLFAFKMNNDARITATVFKDGVEEPIYRQVFPRKTGGMPFTIKWDASAAPAAKYRLVLTGWFLNNNQPVDQTVIFFHQPLVK